MFSPVVPDAVPPLPSSSSSTSQASFKRLSVKIPSDDAAGLSDGMAARSTMPRRSTSKRLLSIKLPSSTGGNDSPVNASSSGVGSRRQSMKFFHRKSTQRGISTKKEIPPHLLKLLQKTPDQKSRLDAVKVILSEEPSARHEGSLDLLYEWMLENCKQYSNNIFGSAPEYIRREICRQMRLIKCLNSHLLIRQGDTGDRCYIVIDGIVDVYVKMKETVANPENPDTPTGSGSGGSGTGTGGANANPAKEYGTMVANLGPGAMFGEVVLLNPSARRNATIIASQYTEQCDLICLERADYIRLVRGASMEASHYNQAEILDQMYLFQGWEKQDKMKIVSAMRSVQFTSNDYLYRAGTDAKWMYIISSGEVVERVNWTVGKLPSSTTSLTCGGPASSTTNSSTSNNGTGSSSQSSTNTSTSSSTSTTTTTTTHNPHNGDQPEKKVNIDLLLVGAGDIVGELPFVKAKWAALFDIKAASDVQALALDRRTFENMILHASATTHKACHATHLKLQKLTSEREDWRQQRLSCGASYPNAHISITWQLMRMSNLRCPRCGQRGHLARDTRRCALPPSPKRAASVVKPNTTNSRMAQLPPLNLKPTSTNTSATTTSNATQAYHKKMTLIGSTTASPRRDSATRALMDESYLPSAREQLQQCRLDSDRGRSGAPLAHHQHQDR